MTTGSARSDFRSSNNSAVRLVPFSELNVDSKAIYLVKGLIPRVGVTVVWGAAKTGKSFWVFDLLMHVALGWPYRKRAVTPGPVVYCAFEGADGFGRRAEAFRRVHLEGGQAKIPFFMVPNRLDFFRDHQNLIEAIKEQLRGKAPAAIVLDTLNRGLVGSENSDQDMGQFIHAADAVKEQFQCAVIIIHHCGLRGSGPRGHSSLTGAADAQLAVRRKANVVSVTVEHMKDGEEGVTLSSRLEPICVGRDDEGQPITSCFVRPTGTPNPGHMSSRTEALVMQTLAHLLQSEGLENKLSDGRSQRCVTVQRLREQSYAQGISKKDSGDAPRVAFKRAMSSLEAANRIVVSGGIVWISDSEH